MANAFSRRILDIPHGLAWTFRSSARENRMRLGALRDLHKGERCFIVANGPSLARTDLELLRGEFAFGMNRIYLLFPDTGFRPTYFVATNELILEQFSGDIMRLQMPKFLNWDRRSLFDGRDPSFLFLRSKMVLGDSFQKDLTRPLTAGGTVTFHALQLAFFMGFRKVILVGLDHSFAEKGTPNTIELRNTEQDASHFRPDYFPKGIKWQLPDLLRSEIAYDIARREFEKDGREVLDATLGGQCPVFKKVDLPFCPLP
jgi:hypothetical protein